MFNSYRAVSPVGYKSNPWEQEVEEETEETDTRTTPTRGGTSALALPPPPPAPPTPDESLFTGWRRSFTRLGPIGAFIFISVRAIWTDGKVFL